MKITLTLPAALAALAAALILGGCLHGSDSGAASSTPGGHLYAVISAPHATASRQAAAFNPGGTGVKPEAVTGCPGIGTLSGRDGNVLHGYSCTGYYFDIDGCSTSSCSSSIQTLPAGQFVLFDGANCGGTMYVATNVSVSGPVSIADAVIPNGVVFRYDPQSTGASDGSTYYEVPAGATATDADVQSVYVFNGAGGGACQVASFTTGHGDKLYAVQALDTAATGLDAAPVQGPVLISTN